MKQDYQILSIFLLVYMRLGFISPETAGYYFTTEQSVIPMKCQVACQSNVTDIPNIDVQRTLFDSNF